MPPASIVRLVLLGTILLGLWLGLRRTAFAPAARARTWLAFTAPLLAWHFAIWRFAQAGGFEVPWRIGRALVPPIPFAIVLPVLVALPLLFRSERIAAVLDAISPAWLVALQVYRVRGGAFLLRWAAGELPGAFALPAGIGDVLVGVLALPAALLVRTGSRLGRAAGCAWNLLGILDLLIAIAMGALTTTGRLPVPVANTATRSYPLVMIPAFAVPLSLILHALSLWQLRRAAAAAHKPALAPTT